jgi:prepilin-type N-terminal cleavage/methylation domain-containing protein
MNYKKNIKIKLGFSLLELSVVLLVTSVLMTAVIKGSDLIDMAKISAAQQKTANSPVWDIDGLQVWYETTLSESFDYLEADDGKAVSVWYDISGNNPNYPNHATQINVNDQPTYQAGFLNGLPVVRFDGLSNFFDLPDGTLPHGNSPYTFFAVSMTESGIGCIINSGTDGIRQANTLAYFNGTRLTNIWNYQNNDLSAPNNSIERNAPHIISITYNNIQAIRNGYINRNLVATMANILPRESLTTNNTIGKSYIWPSDNWNIMNGYIAEIIIFDRALNDQEREDVEDYLSSKYNISIQ